MPKEGGLRQMPTVKVKGKVKHFPYSEEGQAAAAKAKAKARKGKKKGK